MRLNGPNVVILLGALHLDLGGSAVLNKNTSLGPETLHYDSTFNESCKQTINQSIH